MALHTVTSRHPNFKDLTGRKFGKLTVASFSHNNKRGRAVWLCQCACGNSKAILSNSLLTNRQISCGCVGTGWKTHGKSHSAEHLKWQGMKARCSPVAPRSQDYYGRGISVCDRWAESFENFLADMGPCPPGYTLDRIDNDKGYCPGNCRWVPMTIQSRNKRNTRFYEHDGKSMILADWAAHVGMNYECLRGRIRKGWSFAEAIQQ